MAWLPHEMGSEATWRSQKCMMPTLVGMLAIFQNWSISKSLVKGETLVDKSPRSFQMAAYEGMTWKVYLESVYMFALL